MKIDNMEFNEIYDFLRDALNISEETLNYAFGIEGSKAINNLVYFYSGYNSLEQLLEDYKGGNIYE